MSAYRPRAGDRCASRRPEGGGVAAGVDDCGNPCITERPRTVVIPPTTGGRSARAGAALLWGKYAARRLTAVASYSLHAAGVRLELLSKVSTLSLRPGGYRIGHWSMESNEADYRALIEEAAGLAGEELVLYWMEQLPYLCRDEYLASTLRPTEIIRFRQGSFEYVIDQYTALEHRAEIPYSFWEEDRLIVACGRSRPQIGRRDGGRLRGWVGRTDKTFGTAWDKGHYIGHSLGGAVEGLEANVFVQRRDFNRGWSAQGKRFRQMEKYCVVNPNTFCFARPLYIDGTARPTFLDFGVLTAAGRLWIERFDNRYP